MNYTVIEAERQSGISSRKIRFWLDKGLFPDIYKDKNGVRLFRAKDIDWLCWIEFYRTLGMSIKEIKHYKKLCDDGLSTIKERLEIIQEQKAKNLAEIKKLQEANAMIAYKENFYKEVIASGGKNYQQRSFEECKRILEQEIKVKNKR